MIGRLPGTAAGRPKRSQNLPGELPRPPRALRGPSRTPRTSWELRNLTKINKNPNKIRRAFGPERDRSKMSFDLFLQPPSSPRGPSALVTSRPGVGSGSPGFTRGYPVPLGKTSKITVFISRLAPERLLKNINFHTSTFRFQ